MYRTLVERARTALELGESVILDASWSRAAWRVAAARAAEETSTDLVQLRCDATLDVTTRRIERRRTQGVDPSDATADTMGACFEPWPTASPLPTATSVEETLTAALGVVDAG